MFQENEIYIVALLIAGSINVLTAFYAYQHHNKTGAMAFTALMLAAAVYAFGYAFEIKSTTLSGMLFWSKVQYLGISTIPALWIIAAVQYIGKNRWLTRPVLIALFFIPIITLILRYTNEYHHLFYISESINTQGPFPVFSFVKGPWYWVYVAYLNLSILFGNVLFLWMLVKPSAPSYRRQFAVILCGAVAPWISHIIYQFGLSPWGLDLSPFGLTITGLLNSWGFFRYRLIDLAPIAREAVFEGMPEGVLVIDMQNRIIDFNRAAQKIIKNLSLNDIGSNAKEVLNTYPELIEHLCSNKFIHIELKIKEEEDFYYYNVQLSPVVNHRNQLIGKIIVLNDITRQTLLLEKLRMLTAIDSLTEIFNRSFFMELSKKEINRAKRYKKPISVIFMDIDHFKQVNDTYGHKAGDDILKIVVTICKNCLRTPDLYGRYGGDEFVILLPGTYTETSMMVAERLREKISNTLIPLDNAEITVTASFGVAGVNKAENEEFEELLANADLALYRAKKAGRNCVVLYV
ncbi:MAG TPA: hypothetical protein DCR71_04160 [Dehalococcoidia bacterium]|nr:hypothetical protein [Dehalococcoidia bacterium]